MNLKYNLFKIIINSQNEKMKINLISNIIEQTLTCLILNANIVKTKYKKIYKHCNFVETPASPKL